MYVTWIQNSQQVKKILHTYSSYWNNTIILKLIEVKRFYQVYAVTSPKN